MKTNEDQSPWGLILILFGAGILSAFQVGKVPPVLSDIRLDLVSQTGSWSCGSWFLGSVALLGLVLSLFLSRLKPGIRS